MVFEGTPNFVTDGIGGLVRIDDPVSLRLTFRQRMKSVEHSLKKMIAGPVKLIVGYTGLRLAPSHPVCADFERNVEQQGDVRLGLTDG